MARTGGSRIDESADYIAHDDVGRVVLEDAQDCVNHSGPSHSSDGEHCLPHSGRRSLNEEVCSSVALSHLSLVRLGPVALNSDRTWRFNRTSHPKLGVMVN